MTENKVQPHLKLAKVNKFCLVSGNPDRVPKIAMELEESHKVADYRGFVTYNGRTSNKRIPISVLTTGIGSPSTAIILEEAYRAGGRVFIRVGSCGALKSGMNVGDIVIPYAAIRDERTSLNFVPLAFPAAASPEIYEKLCESARKIDSFFHSGIVWSTDIFYTTDKDQYRKWANFGANSVEMESSLIFIFGTVKAIKTGSILVVDGNLADGTQKNEGTGSEDDMMFQQGVQNAIKCAIGAVEMFGLDMVEE